MLGEARIHPGEDDEEMRFEGLDGMLRGIATMDVRRYELVFTVPFLGDHMSILGTGLVVEDLELDKVPVRFEVVHDGVVRLDALLLLARIYGGIQDGV